MCSESHKPVKNQTFTLGGIDHTPGSQPASELEYGDANRNNGDESSRRPSQRHTPGYVERDRIEGGYHGIPDPDA